MTNPAPASTCPNCGKPVSPASPLCPNCGANLPPLPEITNKPNREQVGNDKLWTKSRGGDIAIGISLGVLTPVVLYAMLAYLGFMVSNGSLPDLVTTVLLVSFVPILFGVPFGFAYALKRKYHTAGNAMQKALFGWLILIGLLFLGLLILCGASGLHI